MIADDLFYVSLKQFYGVIFAVGYNTSSIYIEFSEDGGVTKSFFATGAAFIEITDTADETQPDIEILPTGEIVVCLSNGAVETWLSRNLGNTWTQIDSV